MTKLPSFLLLFLGFNICCSPAVSFCQEKSSAQEKNVRNLILIRSPVGSQPTINLKPIPKANDSVVAAVKQSLVKDFDSSRETLFLTGNNKEKEGGLVVPVALGITLGDKTAAFKMALPSGVNIVLDYRDAFSIDSKIRTKEYVKLVVASTKAASSDLNSLSALIDLAPTENVDKEIVDASRVFSTYCRFFGDVKSKKDIDLFAAEFKELLDICTKAAKSPNSAYSPIGANGAQYSDYELTNSPYQLVLVVPSTAHVSQGKVSWAEVRNKKLIEEFDNLLESGSTASGGDARFFVHRNLKQNVGSWRINIDSGERSETISFKFPGGFGALLEFNMTDHTSVFVHLVNKQTIYFCKSKPDISLGTLVESIQIGSVDSEIVKAAKEFAHALDTSSKQSPMSTESAVQLIEKKTDWQIKCLERDRERNGNQSVKDSNAFASIKCWYRLEAARDICALRLAGEEKNSVTIKDHFEELAARVDSIPTSNVDHNIVLLKNRISRHSKDLAEIADRTAGVFPVVEAAVRGFFFDLTPVVDSVSDIRTINKGTKSLREAEKNARLAIRTKHEITLPKIVF